MTSKIQRLAKLIRRAREEIPENAGEAVGNVGKMVHERRERKGKQMNLDDWKRLNKGAKPIAKTARIFGEKDTDLPRETMGEAAIPYKYRRAVYEDYLKHKAASKPTSRLRALGGGAVGGGAVGAALGHRLGGGRGAAVGGALGAVGGAIGGGVTRIVQKRRIAKAKRILENQARIDKEMGKHIRRHRSQRIEDLYKSSSWDAGVMNKLAKIGYREAMAAGLTAGAIYGGHDRWDRSTQKASESERRFKYRRLRNTLAGAAGGGLAGAGLVMTGREILNALREKS
jgi:hypothetical protein